MNTAVNTLNKTDHSVSTELFSCLWHTSNYMGKKFYYALLKLIRFILLVILNILYRFLATNIFCYEIFMDFSLKNKKVNSWI